MRAGERGLIVERSGRKVTALRRNGDLLTFNTDRDDIMIGMEIEVPVKVALFTWKRLAPAVALSLIIVLVSSFAYRQYLYAQPVVAYVSLDSVGSVELEVNGAGIVKSATALDAAGQEALSAVKYQNKPAGEVVQALIKAQDPENAAGAVVALVPAADPEAQPKEAKKAKKAMDRIEEKVTGGKGSTSTKVTSIRLDPEIRNSAQELGISAGRAALWALTQPLIKHGSKAGDDPGSPQPGSESAVGPGQSTTPTDPHSAQPGGSAQPGAATGPGATADPGKTPGPGAKPGGPTDPADSKGPGSSKDTDPRGSSGSKEKALLETIKGSLPKVDLDKLQNDRKNSKEQEDLLKDITKKWLQEVAKQVGKHDKDDRDDDRDGDDDDGRNNDKKGSSGQSKGDNDKGSQGSDSKPGKNNGKDDSDDGGKGSQGKGSSSGKSSGDDSPGKDNGKGSSSKPGKDDDKGSTSKPGKDNDKGSSTKPGKNTSTNFLGDLLNRLSWLRK